MKPRLLFVANYFPPISGPGSIRPYYFLEQIHEDFDRVDVVAASVDTVYGSDGSFGTDWRNVVVHRLAGNDFNCWQRLLMKFRIYGLVHFLWPRRMFERHVNWCIKAEALLEEKFTADFFDIIYVTTGPFCSAMMIHRIAKKWKLPYVLDMRDPFSQSPARNWPSYWHWRRFQSLEKQVIEASVKTIVVAEGMKRELMEVHGLPSSKLEVIRNGFVGEVEANGPISFGQRLSIGYAGSLHDYSGKAAAFQPKKSDIPYRRNNYNALTRSLFHLIEGLKAMNEEDRSRVNVHLWGKHDLPMTKSQIESAGLSACFHFHGKKPFSEVHSYLAEMDLLLLPMEDRLDGQPSYFLTGKLFEYIKMNKPILMLGQRNEALEFLERLKFPHVHAMNDASEIAAAISNVLSGTQNLNVESLDHEALNLCRRETQALKLKEILFEASSKQ